MWLKPKTIVCEPCKNSSVCAPRKKAIMVGDSLDSLTLSDSLKEMTLGGWLAEKVSIMAEKGEEDTVVFTLVADEIPERDNGYGVRIERRHVVPEVVLKEQTSMVQVIRDILWKFLEHELHEGLAVNNQRLVEEHL